MKTEKRALFARKMDDLENLREVTAQAKEDGQVGIFYEVIKEIHLTEEEFDDLAKDFFKEQPWIEKDDGGSNEKREIRCIRVINAKTGERLLINNEGYDYCRYTAIEE